MSKTNIEWCDAVWNPVRGCSRVSPGCVNCYAERQALRFSRDPVDAFYGFVKISNGHPQWTGRIELVESKLTEPLRWKQPKRIFVNSMSDLFHEALPDSDIFKVFVVMGASQRHTFQILTKRPRRMLELISEGKCEGFPGWPLPNVWLGVSVENQATADERIPLLLQTPAAVRFVSYEPALGPVDFSEYLNVDRCPGCRGIDWIIVGGESGPGARPFDIAWARNTVAQCKAAGVACFVKQLGALPVDSFYSEDAPAPLRLIDRKGGDMAEWPVDLRVREFPR